MLQLQFGADFEPTWGQHWAYLGTDLGPIAADFGPTWGRLWVDFWACSKMASFAEDLERI